MKFINFDNYIKKNDDEYINKNCFVLNIHLILLLLALRGHKNQLSV